MSLLAASTLLVEDDLETARSVIDALTDRGHLIDHAETWEDGLALFRVAGHELVIADYKLPGSEHGLQLLVKMRMLLPSTRLVLISGEFGPNAERLAASADFIDAFISKGSASLIADLAGHIEQAVERADKPTDWQAFGAGYLADPERDFPELARIDEALRADIERRRA
jgi:ActR/RegA family two-component response regulator